MSHHVRAGFCPGCGHRLAAHDRADGVSRQDLHLPARRRVRTQRTHHPDPHHRARGGTAMTQDERGGLREFVRRWREDCTVDYGDLRLEDLEALLTECDEALDQLSAVHSCLALPTWHRGMYGCPDDMIAARDLKRALARARNGHESDEHPRTAPDPHPGDERTGSGL